MEVKNGFVPCLVKDAPSEYCNHKDCKYLHKHPVNYFERRSEKIRQRRDFTYFEMHTSYSGTRWILPLNPYQEKTPERSKFELFRQAQGEMEIVGRLPDDRVRYHREEISYKYIARIKGSWMVPDDASIIEMMDYEEIYEVAYFNGPV
jgi:hypothetical protein